MKKNNYFFLITFIYLNFFNVASKADSLFNKGKDIFLNKGECSTCHMLADAGSYGQIGPNLNEIMPGKIRVLNAVINGIGVMPAYQNELSDDEIEAVSYYVSEASNK